MAARALAQADEAAIGKVVDAYPAVRGQGLHFLSAIGPVEALGLSLTAARSREHGSAA